MTKKEQEPYNDLQDYLSYVYPNIECRGNATEGYYICDSDKIFTEKCASEDIAWEIASDMIFDEELASDDFDERSTASKLNLTGIRKASAMHKLIDFLNSTTQYGDPDPKRSVMHYDQLCNHDDGFLCEHRLQFIIDFIKDNFTEK